MARPAEVPICIQAQEKLEQIAFPQTVFDEDSPQFYPRSSLHNAFKEPTVVQILDCLCRRCMEHLNDIGHNEFANRSGGKKPSIWASKILRKRSPQGARALFALLIHIGYPMLIIPFLVSDLDDAMSIHAFCSSPTRLSWNDIENYWPKFKAKNPEKSQNAARKFLQNMYAFSPPDIVDRNFAEYAPGTVLPFYHSKLIGGGTYATVYGFEAHKDYMNLEDGFDSTFLARKELRDQTNIQTFYEERNNLDRVADLRDRHIVPVIKSYRKGNQFNLVFPRAKANLANCFEQPRHGLGSLTTGPTMKARIWDQMRGLARALDRIINYDASDENTDSVFRSMDDNWEHQILGYHFDLKPANILVFEEDNQLVLKISDFGQAKFRDSEGDSRTVNPGGTETYAAPEGNIGPNHKLNTRFDVWSLGCIFTELVTFWHRDHAGIRDFNNARRRTDGRSTNWCYFDIERHQDGASQYALRPSVRTWIDEILTPEPEASQAESNFLNGLRELLFGMLKVNVSERLTSRQVYQKLDSLLEAEFEPPVSVLHTERSPNLSIANSSTSFSAYAREINAFKKDFTRCTLQDIGTLNGSKTVFLATTITSSTFPREHTYCPVRCETFLFPRFAFRRTQEHTTLSKWDFAFGTETEVSFGSRFVYKFARDEDEHQIQGFFTRQDIQHSVKIAVSYAHYVAPPAKLLQIAQKRIGNLVNSSDNPKKISLTVSDMQDPKPSTVQIWREIRLPQTQSTPSEIDDQEAPRMPRRQEPQSIVAACRIVIFRSRSIIIIPFLGATRMQKPIESPAVPVNVVRFQPTRRKIQPYIQIAVLEQKTSTSEELPGIPMDLNKLQELEKASGAKLSYCDLTFDSADDAQKFRDIYLDLKRAWENDFKTRGLEPP